MATRNERRAQLQAEVNDQIWRTLQSRGLINPQYINQQTNQTQPNPQRSTSRPLQIGGSRFESQKWIRLIVLIFKWSCINLHQPNVGGWIKPMMRQIRKLIKLLNAKLDDRA